MAQVQVQRAASPQHPPHMPSSHTCCPPQTDDSLLCGSAPPSCAFTPKPKNLGVYQCSGAARTNCHSLGGHDSRHVLGTVLEATSPNVLLD